MKSAVILNSGRGSNMQALVEAKPGLDFRAVIANRPAAKGLEWAASRGIATGVVDHKAFASREAFDAALAQAIDAHSPDYLLLAGFMRILTEGFIDRYPRRILNIHPSLLPSFPGLDTHRRAIDAGVKLHGATVHFVMVEGGKTRIEAAAAVGVNRRFVGAWVRAVRKDGKAALAGKKRGRRAGEQKALNTGQESRIRRLIIGKCPDQLRLPFALWTREAVAVLIERDTGLRLSMSVIGRYLRAWGFTAQRPMKRATERSEPAIQAWLDSAYPAIAKRAKAEGAEIQWADETGLSNQANYGRSFAPKGSTPVIARPATRFSQSMISSLTNQGKLRFMVYDGALNAAIFLRFLRRLVRDAQRKLFLIVDNLRVHHARVVTAWVRANADRIELFYLPPYAPGHNPDEFLNNDLKQAMARRRYTQGQGRAEVWPHLLHARPAKTARQGQGVLSGTNRPIRRVEFMICI